MLDEIDRPAWREVGKDERCQHVEQDHLQEDHCEREEVPMLTIAKAEACPPRLRRKQQQKTAPDQHWNGEPDPAAGKEDGAIALKHLRNRQAKDDREEDREIAEGV